jgi:hypothetical protein
MIPRPPEKQTNSESNSELALEDQISRRKPGYGLVTLIFAFPYPAPPITIKYVFEPSV